MDWWQKWICDMCMRDQVKSRAVPGLSDICLMGDLFGVVPYTCCRTWSDLSTLFLVFQDMILATVGMQSSYHGHYGCNGIMVLLDHYAVFEVRKHWQRKLDCVIVVTRCVKSSVLGQKFLTLQKIHFHFVYIYNLCLGIMILSRWCSLPSEDKLDAPSQCILVWNVLLFWTNRIAKRTTWCW